MLTTTGELIAREPTLSVGVLGADLLRLGEELDDLKRSNVEVVHVDVMDGIFCPQTTVGAMFVRALPDEFVKDVHLMIAEPIPTLQAYVDAGAGIISFHIEATRHPHRALQSLAGTGVIRGVALNPGTPLNTLEPLLEELDFVLLLAVNPGFPGQSFISATERRLTDAQALLSGREIAIGVDGGITRENIEHVAALGPDLIVTGSAIYSGGSPAENVRTMLEAATRGRRDPLIDAV